MRAVLIASLLALAGCGSWSKPGRRRPRQTQMNRHAQPSGLGQSSRLATAPAIAAVDNLTCARVYGYARCSPPGSLEEAKPS